VGANVRMRFSRVERSRILLSCRGVEYWLVLARVVTESRRKQPPDRPGGMMTKGPGQARMEGNICNWIFLSE
jgi:hypothetical protein